MNTTTNLQSAFLDLPAITAAGKSSATMVRELPESDQPSSRLNFVGARMMSDSELLTLVCNFAQVDTAATLLARAGSLTRLTQMSVAELRETKGVTVKQAEAIRGALELGRRAAGPEREVKTSLRSAEAVFNYAAHMQHLEVEHLVVVLVDVKMLPISLETVHIGGIASCDVAMNQIFKEAIRKNAHGLFLLHNHPSGDPTPSAADIAVTAKAIDAGKLLDVTVHDHIVIGHGRYTSLRERNFNTF
jgi:DNA repair protein RadC